MGGIGLEQRGEKGRGRNKEKNIKSLLSFRLILLSLSKFPLIRCELSPTTADSVVLLSNFLDDVFSS